MRIAFRVLTLLSYSDFFHILILSVLAVPLIFVVYRPVTACAICCAFVLIRNISWWIAQPMRHLGYSTTIVGRHALLVRLPGAYYCLKPSSRAREQ